MATRARRTTFWSCGGGFRGRRELTARRCRTLIQRKTLLYDKSGEEHFNLISALHKSVRSSDADAALYWLAACWQAGEDRMYIARRLVRMAIEDIGLADPRALEQAMAAMQAVHFLGDSGRRSGAGAGCHLSGGSAEIGRAYRALSERDGGRAEAPCAEPVPMHLRNAPTGQMKQWGYGKGYQHAHKFEDAVTDMECLPETLAGHGVL